jgi:uncharacterized protein (TIGR02996 family)
VSEEAAFLEAIRGAPADDTPRLVFADWLDERGEPGDAQWAAGIRLQCRLEHVRHNHRHGKSGRCPRCVLEGENYKFWCWANAQPHLTGHAHCGVNRIRRGFLDTAFVYRVAWDARHGAILRHPLQRLFIRFTVDHRSEIVRAGQLAARVPRVAALLGADGRRWFADAFAAAGGNADDLTFFGEPRFPGCEEYAIRSWFGRDWQGREIVKHTGLLE